jgi:hypothetical protein
VDWSKHQPLEFERRKQSIWLSGPIYCYENVILEVEKELETQIKGRLLQVRGKKYRYAAWVRRHHSLLRYHNVHRDDDDYHHRVFNWRTGEEVLYERLERHQFPTLSEVLDEVQAVYLAYE